MICLSVIPCDPLIARDGRPSVEGLRMKSLRWPYPSVLAGSLRTLLGKQAGGAFPPEQVKALKEIVVAGPLPFAGGQLFFPTPKDVALDPAGMKCFGARPRTPGGGARSNLPTGLDPVLLPENLVEDFKPAPLPAFWSCTRMSDWMINAKGQGFEIPPNPEPPERRNASSGFLDAPGQEERTHTAVDASTSTAQESMLFQTVGLPFEEGITLAAQADAPNGLAAHLAKLNTVHPFGGERRLAHWKAAQNDAWKCPAAVRSAMAGIAKGDRIRLTLATPGLFDGGRLPGWLDPLTLRGRPRNDLGCELQLKGACVDRWQPVSGWSLENGKTGPKEMRRLAPAGSVYFFEVAEGNAAGLADLWLRPMSDRIEDRRDGFGLALWGIWSE